MVAKKGKLVAVKKRPSAAIAASDGGDGSEEEPSTPKPVSKKPATLAQVAALPKVDYTLPKITKSSMKGTSKFAVSMKCNRDAYAAAKKAGLSHDDSKAFAPLQFRTAANIIESL